AANSKASAAEPLAAAGPEENGRRGNEVDEAEFEDFAAASEERAEEVSVQTPRVQARTILGLGAVGANIKRVSEQQQSPERASAAERASAEPANGDDKGVLNTRPPPLTQPSARGGENTSNAGTQAVLSNAAGSRADDVPAPEGAPTATPGTTAQGTKGPAEPLEQTFFA